MSSQLSPQQSGMKLPNQLSGYGVLSSPGQANPQHELAASAPLGPSAKTGHLSTASRSFPAPAVMQWDYIASRDDELSAKAGETIMIAGEYKNAGWLWAYKVTGTSSRQSSTRGLVPANYFVYTKTSPGALPQGPQAAHSAPSSAAVSKAYAALPLSPGVGFAPRNEHHKARLMEALQEAAPNEGTAPSASNVDRQAVAPQSQSQSYSQGLLRSEHMQPRLGRSALEAQLEGGMRLQATVGGMHAGAGEDGGFLDGAIEDRFGVVSIDC